MSNAALNAVWEYSDARGAALLVLVALADAANDDGVCWPGNAKLSLKVRMSERSLQENIGKLIDQEELVVEGAERGTRAIGGRGKRSVYRILLPPLPEYKGATNRTVSEDEKGAESSEERVRKSSTKGADIRDHSYEPSKNPKRTHNGSANGNGKLTPRQREALASGAFPDFWAIYPRREGRRSAENAFIRAVKRGHDPVVIIEGARAYADAHADEEKRFIKGPEAWLNAERFLDEQTDDSDMARLKAELEEGRA